MLVQFTVGNFRSFGDEATLNMIAGTRSASHAGHLVKIPNTQRSVLRNAVIYGANAAGKSNLVKAMKFAQSAIISAERFQPASPFGFDEKFATKPSSFEFRFLLGGRIYIYGFDISIRQIESEWLAVVQGSAEVDIFKRSESGNTDVNQKAKKLFEADDPTMFSTLEKLKELPLKPHQLFLNRASTVPAPSQGTTLAGIIRWLTQDLLILTVDHRSRDILNRIQFDDFFRTFSRAFLSDVGTGVADLRIALTERAAENWEQVYFSSQKRFAPDVEWMSPPWQSGPHTDARPDPTNPSKIIVRTLFSEHRVNQPNSAFLPFVEESDGTQQLLQFMPVICPAPGDNKVVVIDELDRSLHPLICWTFIEFFSESLANSRRQLIVTTHEVHLLNQDLLRRDEYWFVEKDAAQQSRLTSLSEFDIRGDLKLERGYLNGRFGGIPVIGGLESLRRLLECENERNENAATEATP